MTLNLSPDIIMPCIYAFFASLGFGFVFNLHGKKMFYAALGGGISWFVYLLFAGCFETDIPQYFISMIVVALYAEIMARLHKVPATVYLVISYIPLVPGGGAYYTMVHLVNGNTEKFVEVGLHTLFIAGAIAMGIVLVSSLTRIYSVSRFRSIKKKRRRIERERVKQMQ